MTDAACPFRVIASHPSKQAIAYRPVLGAQRHGIPVRFLTGLYYKPERIPRPVRDLMPGRLDRMLQKRRLPGLDPKNVVSVSGPWPEILRRNGRSGYASSFHDNRTAVWLARNLTKGHRSLFHTFLGYCVRSQLLARELGLPTILELTTVPWKEELFAEFDRLGLEYTRGGSAELVGAESADYLVAQSPYAASMARRNAPKKTTFLLPMGVDLARFKVGRMDDQPKRRKHGGIFRAIFVGYMSHAKGLHLLLKAWSMLNLRDAELLLVGQVYDEDGAQLLRNFEGKYRHVGFVEHDQLPDLYSSSDLFVFPSLIEGGPLVTLEAMASGLPCVVSTAGRSLLRHQCEGLVVEETEAEAYAQAIDCLYRDEMLRHHMGTSARRRAEAFGWDDYYRRVATMYRIVAEGSHKEPGLIDLTST